ncbi:MAG: ATP-dependent zinc metalloprotease FtsH [Bacillota bacterium]|nr:ATP-dependent zinc metalloprotease FtsH [Bacillota bacterium]
MKINLKSFAFYALLILVIITAITLLDSANSKEKLKYSDIIAQFEGGKVQEFVIDENNNLTMKLQDNTEQKYRLPSANLFLNDVGDLIKQQRRDGILKSYDYEAAQQLPVWVSFIPYALLILVFGAMWYFMMSNMNGGGSKAMSFAKSRAKKGIDESRKKTFDDVAGADEEKEELKEVVDFLKNPRKYMEIGARIPKGILLVGPPGTGKTLLARAVAGEAGVPFFSISGSDFVEMFVGVGASRVRDLFEQAKKNLPCIIFIDEIDAVGRHRGAGLGGGHDEREQTLNQLLVEMDGFGTNEGVIIIAATNRPDILDPALLRPGRFDRQIVVNVPDIKGREEILKVHARGKPLAQDVNLKTIAKSTAGFTGADLENLLNEAALLAARLNTKVITEKNIQDATIKVIVGPEKRSRVITERENRLTAYHEAGHAIVSRFLETQDPVHEISIIPRGRAGGYTLSLPKEDKYYSTRQEMEDEIVVLLGGRAAEKLALTDISTGASNDLERSTNIARQMITKYGMSDKLGPVVFGNPHEEVFLGRDFTTTKNISESFAAQIDNELKNIIDKCYEKAIGILDKYMDKLHVVAKTLLEKEKISGEEFEAIFNTVGEPEDSNEI